MSDSDSRPQPDERAPVGTWSAAGLVTDYFRIEYRLKTPIRWRIPIGPRKAPRLRRELARCRKALGIEIICGVIEPRPGAGQRLVGPLGLPSARLARPSPTRIIPPRPDFRMPTEAVYVRGLTWRFRTEFDKRQPDLTPMFTCLGLITPGRTV